MGGRAQGEEGKVWVEGKVGGDQAGEGMGGGMGMGMQGMNQQGIRWEDWERVVEDWARVVEDWERVVEG